MAVLHSKVHTSLETAFPRKITTILSVNAKIQHAYYTFKGDILSR